MNPMSTKEIRIKLLCNALEFMLEDGTDSLEECFNFLTCIDDSLNEIFNNNQEYDFEVQFLDGHAILHKRKKKNSDLKKENE